MQHAFGAGPRAPFCSALRSRGFVVRDHPREWRAPGSLSQPQVTPCQGFAPTASHEPASPSFLIILLKRSFRPHWCRYPCFKFYFPSAQDLTSQDQFEYSGLKKQQGCSKAPVPSLSCCTISLGLWSLSFWNWGHTYELVNILPLVPQSGLVV